ncbi:glutamate receptor ionotropic, delta-2 isoform X3 [Photinus pyralis]|uniref:glutamate receptor ionotropic, delta-2 isoform X3 n=1 Tax=Photinus pyralis TaxID=7054 RepID=UPI00126718E2|nr:glutamate receptor ionotropic, delta-2 isoform X3 [Photinus pyralis]
MLMRDPETKKGEIRKLGKMLRDEHITIVTTQNKPLHYVVEDSNGQLVGKGAAFDLLHYIKEQYEFNYTVTLYKDQGLGNKNASIIRELGEGRADIAVAFVPILPGVDTALDYSPILDLGEWMLLMKRPSESATGSGLLAPFTSDVWILILISLISMGPIVSLLILWHKKLCPGEQNLTHSLFECVWFVYGAIIKQGSTMYPTADSTRLLFAVWWIFITILTAFYTANLTAFLTISMFTLPVSKAEDIGAKKYSWIADDGGVIQWAMDDVLQKPLHNSIPIYKNDRDAKVIMEDYVRVQNYLYINDRLILEDMLYNDYMNRTKKDVPESERCVFVITKWPILTIERAFAYKKNFKYKPLFDKILSHLVESGVVKFKMQEHLPKASICPLNLKSIERQLRNTDFLLTYYIISCGFGSSLLSFLVESLIGYQYKKKLKKAKAVENDDLTSMPPLPPPYHTLFQEPFNYPFGQKENINGREYWVVPSDRGKEIVPVRATSAMMFQYTH